MSAPSPHEQRLLSSVDEQLNTASKGQGHVGRLDVLEAVAAELGGFELAAYRQLRTSDEHVLDVAEAEDVAKPVVVALSRSPIHPSLALASLSRPPLDHTDRRKAGAYYTDFRLARYLAQRAVQELNPSTMVIDPAAGSGILLVATALEGARQGTLEVDEYIRAGVHAADLDSSALRAASLSLSSLTEDLSAIEAMLPRLRRLDSLMVGRRGWRDVAPDGFGLVIQNPPWEKLKVSRHEFLLANGIDRHYGSHYRRPGQLRDLQDAREAMRVYVDTLAADYELQGTGEADLYKLFTELAALLAHKDGGHIALVLPAGLIRSQGTEDLRAFLFDRASTLEATVFENRARFFAIDTRFKFLTVQAQVRRDAPRRPLVLDHAEGAADAVDTVGHAVIGRTTLSRLRDDLTVPEVRSTAEWDLFRRLSEAGPEFGAEDGPWKPEFCREVDMTRDRDNFVPGTQETYLPLMEGRMVHQFRHAAKAYVSGTGRAAVWNPLPLGDYRIEPQFGYPSDELPPAVSKRTHLERVGFCDVTGQTNERSLLAARIPPGVVCGNKVPTITFDVDEAEHERRLDLWVAIANSFVVDWFLRRILTTSVNYFLLKSVPMPAIDASGAEADALIRLSRSIRTAETDGRAVDMSVVAAARAEIDARVAAAYGLTCSDMELVMQDFPLLDRGQPPLADEDRSTVTRDSVLSAGAELLEPRRDDVTVAAKRRVEQAHQIGAVAYLPSEYSE